MQIRVQIITHKLLKSFKTFQKLGVKTLNLTVIEFICGALTKKNPEFFHKLKKFGMTYVYVNLKSKIVFTALSAYREYSE